MNAERAPAGLAHSLVALEQAVYGRAPQAMELLIQLLLRLASGKLRMEPAQGEQGHPGIGAAAARIAAAAGACLADPSRKLRERDVERLALAGRTLENLFAASDFGTSDHVLAALGARDGASFARLWRSDRQAFVKALALLSIDSRLPIDPRALFAGEPRFALLGYLSLLSAKPITSAAGQARRERLLELAPELPLAELPRTLDHLVLLSSAWMLCSYAERRDKHQVKRKFNRILRAWMLKGGMEDATLASPRALPERPTMLVAAEIMQSNHVQYRYFGQYLRQLRGRFRLVLLTEKSQVDEHVKTLFDQVHLYERRADAGTLAGAVAWVKKLAPDLIFWPSVGMRHWGPPLANLRLAPIQFTALGHSASTFCDTIDYYLTEEGYVGDPALFSEQLVLLPDESLVFERSPHYRPVAPRAGARPGPLRIALPSNLLKLNPKFIAVLRRIREAAKRPIQFHVFPNVQGTELHATRRALARELPGALVYPTMAYMDYLERLAACDLNLSPFPFGGLHSVVDSLRLGVPVVAMEGLEPHARTDAMLLRRLGMPEGLIAKDVEGYVAAALRVIADDAGRAALGRRALALDIDRTLYGDATTPLRSEVADAVWWMYRNHEAIQASGKKVFTQKEWRAS